MRNLSEARWLIKHIPSQEFVGFFKGLDGNIYIDFTNVDTANDFGTYEYAEEFLKTCRNKSEFVITTRF